MASQLLFETVPSPSAVILADTTDYGPGATAANNFGSRTHQIDLTSLGADAYRQSAKFDLGANPAPLYAVYFCIEMDVAPTAGLLINGHFFWSNSSTAGQGNAAGLSGSDAAYTGYSSNAAAAIKQLGGPQAIMPVTVQIATTVQVGFAGYVMPTARYGICVIHNGTNQAFEGDAVEMAVVLLPVVIEAQ